MALDRAARHDDGAEADRGDTAEGADLAALAARIQGGERAAEAELAQRFAHGLLLMLRRMTQNAALADDLRQDTLALVLEKIRRGEVRQPERLAGFIRSTARNLFIAACRKEARFTPLEDHRAGTSDARPAGEDSGGGRAGTLADREPAALDRLLAGEEADQVRRLLGELRFERDRQLLVRFYLLEHDRERICAELEIEAERFNQVLHRARERMRELWQRADKRRRFFSAVRGFVGTGGRDRAPGR